MRLVKILYIPLSTPRPRYENLKDETRKEEDRIQDERRRQDKERTKMENKEAELMEAANMIQEKSREIEETYNVSNYELSK